MNPTQQTCHYRALEVEPGASRATVEQAYQRLSQIFGPTSLAVYGLVDDARQQGMLETIEAAFRTLGDPAARAAYDDARGHPPAPEAKADPVPADPVVEAPVVEAPVAAELAEAEPLIEPILLGDEHIEVVLEELADFASAREEPVKLAEPVEPEAPEASPPPTAPRESLTVADASIRQGLIPKTNLPVAQVPGPSAEEAAPEGSLSPAASQEAASKAVDRPPPLPPMPALDADTSFTGDILRAVREARGLSLQQVAARTRITSTHLGNIELERWDWLPERVFLRGFLISFARELKLDPAKVSETYLARRDGSR